VSETRTGWAERRASFDDAGLEEAVRVSRDDSAELVADVSLAATGEVGPAGGDPSRVPDDVVASRRDDPLRSAVNDLQHRLLTADPQADVHGFALERLMTAAGADRVCAFRNAESADGRAAYELYAEAAVGPELSLLNTAAATVEAYDDVAPGLLEDLAAGRPYASRVEFLTRRAAERLAGQGADSVLLLPLFVDGAFHGFLRLDRCDRARLWGEAETAVLVSAAGSISAAIERQQVVKKMVQRSHELAALLATSRSITSSIDYEVVLREVASAAAEALGCPESVIWEYSPTDQMAVYRVLYQKDPKPGVAEALVGSAYPMGDYPGGLEAVRQGVVAQQSFSDADLSEADRRAMLEWGEKTWLSVPLVYGGDVLGMMVLIESEHERRFTQEEVRMASLIGEQAAAGLHNARLHRLEEDQHRWLAALAEATRVIASRLDRVELLKDVARLATDALLVAGALVYEFDERSGAFAPRAVAGDGARGGAATVGAAVAGELRRGEPVLHLRDDPSLAAEVAAAMDAAGEQSVAWVPFRINDETLGAMRLVERSKPRRFAEGELSFARALGEHAAIALNNARLYAQIEDQATKDGLTGLANHRHFYDRLAEELERARRTRQPVTLLMLDIDDFKRLNDTYGHPAGDEVLRTIGRLMQAELRKGGDLAARYGGEEFCVILPAVAAVRPAGRAGEPAPETGATALAERLRRRIASFPFPLGPAGDPVRVTVSIGVASWPNGAEGLDELVGRADAALYAAKRAGKDRVEVY
jgi:diguanylate cyclase (GGDEF)-like protein